MQGGTGASAARLKTARDTVGSASKHEKTDGSDSRTGSRLGCRMMTPFGSSQSMRAQENPQPGNALDANKLFDTFFFSSTDATLDMPSVWMDGNQTFGKGQQPVSKVERVARILQVVQHLASGENGDIENLFHDGELLPAKMKFAAEQLLSKLPVIKHCDGVLPSGFLPGFSESRGKFLQHSDGFIAATVLQPGTMDLQGAVIQCCCEVRMWEKPPSQLLFVAPTADDTELCVIVCEVRPGYLSSTLEYNTQTSPCKKVQERGSKVTATSEDDIVKSSLSNSAGDMEDDVLRNLEPIPSQHISLSQHNGTLSTPRYQNLVDIPAALLAEIIPKAALVQGVHNDVANVHSIRDGVASEDEELGRRKEDEKSVDAPSFQFDHSLDGIQETITIHDSPARALAASAPALDALIREQNAMRKPISLDEDLPVSQEIPIAPNQPTIWASSVQTHTPAKVVSDQCKSCSTMPAPSSAVPHSNQENVSKEGATVLDTNNSHVEQARDNAGKAARTAQVASFQERAKYADHAETDADEIKEVDLFADWEDAGPRTAEDASERRHGKVEAVLGAPKLPASDAQVAAPVSIGYGGVADDKGMNIRGGMYPSQHINVASLQATQVYQPPESQSETQNAAAVLEDMRRGSFQQEQVHDSDATTTQGSLFDHKSTVREECDKAEAGQGSGAAERLAHGVEKYSVDKGVCDEETMAEGEGEGDQSGARIGFETARERNARDGSGGMRPDSDEEARSARQVDSASKRKKVPGCCVGCGTCGSIEWHDSKKHGKRSLCDSCHKYNVNNALVNTELHAGWEEIAKNTTEGVKVAHDVDGRHGQKSKRNLEDVFDSKTKFDSDEETWTPKKGTHVVHDQFEQKDTRTKERCDEDEHTVPNKCKEACKPPKQNFDDDFVVSKKSKRLPGCCLACGSSRSIEWHDCKRHGKNSLCDTCHKYNVNNALVNTELESDQKMRKTSADDDDDLQIVEERNGSKRDAKKSAKKAPLYRSDEDDEGWGRCEDEEDGSSSPPKKKRKRLPGCCGACGTSGSFEWHDSKKHGKRSLCDSCHKYNVNNAHVNTELESYVQELDPGEGEMQTAMKLVGVRGKAPHMQLGGLDSQAAASYLDSSQVYGATSVACPVIEGECHTCGRTESEGWYDGELGPLSVCKPCYKRMNPPKERHSVTFVDQVMASPNARKRLAANTPESHGNHAKRPFQGGKGIIGSEEDDDGVMACSQTIAERPAVVNVFQTIESYSGSARKDLFSGMSFIITGQSDCETRLWAKKERNALAAKIAQKGGTVMNDPHKIQAGREPSRLVVISCGPCKTFKYLAALALGVQPVEPSWAEASIQEGVLQPIASFALAAGLDVETHRSFELPSMREFAPLNAAKRALHGVRVCARGYETFSSELNQLLALAGATVCAALADAQYLICPQEKAEKPSKGTLLQASALRIPVVSKDWLIQSLWEQRAADIKPFQIDDGTHLANGDRIRLWSAKGQVVCACGEKLATTNMSPQDKDSAVNSIFTVEQSESDQSRGTDRFALRASSGLFVTIYPDGYMCVQKSRAMAAEHLVIKPLDSSSRSGSEGVQVTIKSWQLKYVTAGVSGKMLAEAKEVSPEAVFELEFV